MYYTLRNCSCHNNIIIAATNTINFNSQTDQITDNNCKAYSGTPLKQPPLEPNFGRYTAEHGLWFVKETLKIVKLAVRLRLIN